jgi:UTP-glucose-1-phosphate uridylyltransferase/mevalonate kinase
MNSSILPGQVIIVGTNQGLYAQIDRHDDFIYNAVFSDGSSKSYICKMDEKSLSEHAKSGDFFSYAAGVAYEMIKNYNVKGLVINNYKTTLPIKKGLSSSAATCVLVARAFNKIYDLKMTVKREMEMAYLGEIATPSRCGRMDQGCAYGNSPILMEFDSDEVDCSEIKVSKDVHMVVVDLCSNKDTIKILSDLSKCYPFPENDDQKGVHEYLGAINISIVNEAISLLKSGNLEYLGKLMTSAQSLFDKFLSRVCPSQLNAPKLHFVLSHEKILPLVYGGKGIGSQGDGSAQFITKNKECQDKLLNIINELGMNGLPLTIKSNNYNKITKAVIPVAGFGTRLYPMTRFINKMFLPVIKDNFVKPVILFIVEEILNAGIDEICLVIQEKDKKIIEEYFNKLPDNYDFLPEKCKKYCHELINIGGHIKFAFQNKQNGLGHAVSCSKEIVGDSPFLLVLGDYVFKSNKEESCVKQLLEIHKKYNDSNVIGLKKVSKSESKYCGCVDEYENFESVIKIKKLIEKPSEDYFVDDPMAIFGYYILNPEIFNLIDNYDGKNEVQLTSALNKLDDIIGYMIDGNSYDIGNVDSYSHAIKQLF